MTKPSFLDLTKQLYFSRSGLLLVTVFLIAIGLTFAALRTSGSEREIFIAVATSLFASATFAYLETMLTGLSHESIIARAVEESVSESMRNIQAEARHLNDEFLPSNVFIASPRPDPEFNKLLTADMRKTKVYHFLGITGRFAIARLASNASILEEAHLIIANPFGTKSIDHRVRHVASFVTDGGEYETEKQKLCDEIFQAIAGSVQAALKCRKLAIYFTDEPIVNRFELFDASLFVTLYSDEQKNEALFPRTLRFSNSSFAYGVFLSRVQNLPSPVIEVLPGMRQGDLANLLSQNGYPITEAQLIRHKKEFDDFYTQYVGILNRA